MYVRQPIVGIKAPSDPAVARLGALAATGGQPNTHPSPPIVTLGALGGATAVPSPTAIANGAAGKFNYMGGDWSASGTTYPNTVYWSVYNTTLTAGTVRSAIHGAIEFTHTGRYIEPAFQANGQVWRLLVDDMDAGDLPNRSGSSNLYRVLIDFGSVATRKVRLEYDGGSGNSKIWEIVVGSSDTVTATTDYPHRLVILGDSMMGQTGAATARDAASHLLSYQLGFVDFNLSSSGGTGWEQDGPTPFFGIDGNARFDADVTAYTPLVAILALGLNDVGDGTEATIQTNVAAKLDALRAASPDTLVHVFGPFDPWAPSAPGAGFDTLNTAIEAACAGKRRVWFHSLKGIAFTKSDTTHPDTAGHTTLYKAMFNKIAASHGISQIN